MLSCTEFCALSSGHGPRGNGFEGFCKTLGFHHFWGFENAKKHEKSLLTWSDLGFRSSRPSKNYLLKNPEKIRGFSAQKNIFLTELSRKFGAPGVADFQSIAEIE